MRPLPSPSAPASARAGHYGLSWAALVNRWLVIGLAVTLLGLSFWFDLWDSFTSMPYYWLVAAASAWAWWPYMVGVHRRNMTQLVVYDGPGRLSLFRVGNHVPGFEIEGEPVHLSSRSGVHRLFVTDFDQRTGKAEAVAVDGRTPMDHLTNAHIFDRLVQDFVALRTEDRLTRELVAARVSDEVKTQSDRWLSLLYGSLDLSELETAIMAATSNPVEVEEEVEEYHDEGAALDV